MTILRKNWIHVLIWAAMLLYVMAAVPFHTRFLLKDGKPVMFNGEVPKNTQRISYGIDRFDLMVLRRQNLYQVWGWAFVQGDPDPAPYQRLLVLRSTDNQMLYFFPTSGHERPDIQTRFPDLNLLGNTGFSAYISKDVLPPGIYRIGLLFDHQHDGKSYYLLTQEKIIRTPNTLKLLTP